MKYVTRILLATVILGIAPSSALMGYAQQSNDYAQYEQRAWEFMHTADRERLLQTVILSNLNRAIDLAPDLVRTDSYAIRAHCWDKAGEDEKAFQDRMTVIQREPNDPKRAKTYVMLAGELACRGDFILAKEYIDHSIVLAPDYALARATRSLIYVGMGEWDKWEDELNAAIEMDPSITNMCTVQEMSGIAEKKKRELQP